MSLRRRSGWGVLRTGSEYPPRHYLLDHGIQFLAEEAQINRLLYGRLAARHLAIDAMEVADLVGIQIDADGDSPGPAASTG